MVRLLPATQGNYGIMQRPSFNPTMVRLLLFKVDIINFIREKFQSHNGAIAAMFNAKAFAQVSQFQSHNGAIAAAQLACEVVEQRVSIPQWCDCCPATNRPTINIPLVSIPQWCDCCGWGRAKCQKSCQVSIPQWCDCCSSSWLA